MHVYIVACKPYTISTNEHYLDMSYLSFSQTPFQFNNYSATTNQTSFMTKILTNAGQRFAPAFSSVEYRRLWLANFSSFMGFWMASVTQGWLVVELTESPFMLGFLVFFRSIPMLVLSPFGGILADRVKRTRLLLLAQAMMAFTDLITGILVLLGIIQIWHLALAGISVGTQFALSSPARTALVSDIVPRKHLSNAVALTSITMNSSRILGPTLAGFLIGIIGIAGTYFSQVLAYVLAYINVWRVKAPPITPGFEGSAFNAMREGFSYVIRSRFLLPLMVLSTSPALFSMSSMMLLPAFVKQDLQGSAQDLGMLMGFVGIGAIIGSLSVVAFSEFKYKGAVVMIAAFMDGVMVVGLSMTTSILAASIALVGMGFCQAIYMAMIQTIMQLVSSTRMRGRVLSIWMLGWGLTPVGLLPISALAENIGTPTAMIVSGGVAIFIALLVMIIARNLWTLDPEDKQFAEQI